MGLRAALILALGAAVAGCFGDDTSNGHGDDMSAGAHDMGGIFCAPVAVTASSDFAPARLTASTDVAGVSGASWTLTRAGDPDPLPLTVLDPSKLKVQYDATLPGTYTFVVSFASGPCPGSGSKTLQNPTGAVVKYRLRALPPETAMLPLKDTPLALVGGVPLAAFDLTLSSGTQVSGTLRGPGGAAVAGEVRLIADTGPDAVTTTRGEPFTLAVLGDGLYTPLLVPRDATLAPHLGQKAHGLDFVGAPFVVGAGAPVGGTVADPGGAPVAGVHVGLRAGPLPSGPGESGADGSFSLRAEAGSYTLAFGSDAWPQASVAGVTVPPGGASLGIRYTIARHAVAGTVLASDGKQVGGARVTILSAPLGTVAQVSVGGSVLAAAGRVARVVSSASDGSLPPLLLPDGSYDVVVEPPAGATDGLTALAETVAGGATWTLTLQPRIVLGGRVTSRAGLPAIGARVTAFEQAGLGAAPETLTDNDGRYTVTVDPGAPVQLLVEPSAMDKLSSRRLALAAGSTQADVVLPPGLLVSGKVLAPTGSSLPGVRIEALCWSCADPTPLAEAVSDAYGGYRLYLPDPGAVVIVDGGAGD